MSWLWRLVLTLYNLALVALGTAMISAAAGNTIWLDTITYWFTNPWERIWAGAVGGLLFVLGLMLIILTLKREKPPMALVKDAEFGHVYITIPAVEQVVLKSARTVPGVREARPVISSSRPGLKIYLHLLTMPDAIIPELTSGLQQTVKTDVERLVGIPVLELKILVDDKSAGHGEKQGGRL
ncbi:MAG: alkaline shock response membrane anchor protein AmaP [Methylocystaceae bacterium]